jgi:electron transport complex protein RnfD
MLAEAVALQLRGKPVGLFITDGSAVLTAVLLAFALPPLVPWWITVSGAAFAILVAKHLYGGLGYNVFNPAMVGYAALLVSFPVHMTRWLLPSGLAPTDLTFAQTWLVVFTGHLPYDLTWDAITGATPLSSVRAGLILRATMDEIHAQPIFGALSGKGWEWVAVATTLGGATLLALRVIRWQIPVAMIGSILVCATLMHALDPGNFAGPVFHLFSGATLLGAFFIATDPVSAATSERGRLIYGAGIGVLTFVIRAWGGYPDGVAFAVLLMNAAVPLIDRYTIPRIYGHSK